MADQHLSANNTSDIERPPITEDEGENHHQSFDGHLMLRVPEVLRVNKRNLDDHYAPKIVSIGPYYHGLPELRKAEELKHEVLELSVSRSSKQLLYRRISEVIDQIRNCYVGVSRDRYGDEELAEMMLLDASFALCLIDSKTRDGENGELVHRNLGIAAMPFVFNDLILFENQIPLMVISLLYELTRGAASNLIYELRRFIAFVNNWPIEKIPVEGERLPFHLLDAFYQLFVKDVDDAEEEPSNRRQRRTWRRENPNKFWDYNRQSRSVTDLKAKGIHFKPSSYCFKDIKFKSYTFYGQLQLPVLSFDANSRLILVQSIAYEMSLGRDINFIVLCYVNFMKSLIVKSEDVKELREKKILISDLDSDEQIVEAIKGIDTHSFGTDSIFYEVKNQIAKHCSSEAKTWIAELIHTYFRSPWTSIALFAATFLLCLTFLQTYYTINPRK
ncbi:UPF0481 protein At3g47200-like [Olea europaea var. sylvestris]|uniref:UPF0481 protein At3g47200-like n=1 Tax=Olea europaea var. sylvestris TaxID=158386 RepID=UPI000C1D4F48|nr:UPF0481 protein At3g47200-like [Olea europaea var. sylvestris]